MKSSVKHAQTRKQKIRSFDPNGPGTDDAGLYGLPFGVEESQVVVVPVPWDATVSYGCGTAGGPAAVLEASRQVDLYDPDFPDSWKIGIAMDSVPAGLKRASTSARTRAERVINALESGRSGGTGADLRAVNAACERMVRHVEERTGKWIEEGKLVALLGGDHSTPLGYLKALAGRYPSFGILQIDAHADLRNAYEGFVYSHASIMYNALSISAVSKIVQVGIRDVCEEEIRLAEREKKRVAVHYDRDLKRAAYRGKNTETLYRNIIRSLPENVYVSFDIDGLDPRLCPNTGTPVPGGLDFEEALHLIGMVAESGRRIIGLDLVEVAPGADEWDANVGARLLFRMIGIMAKSNRLKP